MHAVWIGGLSFIVHIFVNILFKLKRSLGNFGRFSAPVLGKNWFAPSRGSYAIVGLIFFLITASFMIILFSVTALGGNNFVFLAYQIESLKQPAIARTIGLDAQAETKATPAKIATAGANANETEKTDPIAGEKVRKGEGFWQATLRLVKKEFGDDCAGSKSKTATCRHLNAYYRQLTAAILDKNGIVVDGRELRIANPGAVVSLDAQDNLYIDGKRVEIL